MQEEQINTLRGNRASLTISMRKLSEKLQYMQMKLEREKIRAGRYKSRWWYLKHTYVDMPSNCVTTSCSDSSASDSDSESTSVEELMASIRDLEHENDALREECETVRLLKRLMVVSTTYVYANVMICYVNTMLV